MPDRPLRQPADERLEAGDPPVAYHLCPRCSRATPSAAGEDFCPNDGTRMLHVCPGCGAPITSPFAEYCTKCGAPLLAGEEGGAGRS